MKLKLNANLRGNKSGDVIDVDDVNGVPTEIFWRRRLRDSAIDNCCEVVTDKPKMPKAKPASSSKDREGA